MSIFSSEKDGDIDIKYLEELLWKIKLGNSLNKGISPLLTNLFPLKYLILSLTPGSS